MASDEVTAKRQMTEHGQRVLPGRVPVSVIITVMNEAIHIERVVERQEDRCDAYFVNRRMVFLGRWLRHVWWYPDCTVRLVRRGPGCAFEDRSVHERWVCPGPIGYLGVDLVHENLKLLHEYMARLNRYATLEALEILRWRWTARSGGVRASFSGDWAERRRALKLRVWFRLPF